MVGVGNQASSPSSENTLRTICTSTKVEFFLLVPGHPGTTPSYAPGILQGNSLQDCRTFYFQVHKLKGQFAHENFMSACVWDAESNGPVCMR